MSATTAFEKEFVRPKNGRTLIVGSRLFSSREDRRKRYADSTGVDMDPGKGVDVVLDMEEPAPEWLGKFAHIECLSVLEHSRRPWLMAANLESLLEEGGTMFISVPLAWRIHKYSGDYWRILPDGLRALFAGTEWHAIGIATDNELFPEDLKKIPSVTKGDVPYIQRCETLGFGSKVAP